MSGLDPFRWAAAGVGRTLATERNLKIHWVSALAVMMVCMALELETWARVALWSFTALVISAELFNSALESAIDGATRERTPWARDAKDAAAGAVLVLAVGAVLALTTVVASHRATVAASGGAILRTVTWGLPASAALGGLLFAPVGRSARLALAALAAIAFGPLVLSTRDPASAAIGVGLIGIAALSRLATTAPPRKE